MTEEKKETKKERVGIPLVIYPDWKGKRSTRYVGIGKTNYRFDVGIPVPSNDKEAQELYSCNLADLIEKGAIQFSYDRDTNIGNTIKEDLEKGADFGKLEDPSKYASCLQDEMSVPKERKTGTATAEKAAVKTIKAAGIDMSTLTDPAVIEAIKKAQAKKTQA